MALKRAACLALAFAMLASASAAAPAAVRPASAPNPIQESSPAPDRQPSVAALVQAVPPRDLADVLLAVPFPVVGLPLGVDESVVLPSAGTADDPDLAGLVQGITVEDPDQPFPFASYLVFASADQAAESIDRTIAETGDGTSESVSLPGYDGAAFLVGDDGFWLCQIPVANVAIIGLAVGDDPDEGREAALAYATAALAHLERLATDYATGATPIAATGPLGQVPPRVLYERLLAEPFPDDGLPPGFSGGEIVAWEAGDSDLIGTIGGAYLTFDGNGEAGVAFLVYPNEGAAQRKFDERVEDAVAEGLGSVEVGGFNYPSRLLTFEDYGVVLVRVGYVIVIGSGALDEAVAIGFARAGVAHVERLAADSSEATPT